MRQPFGYALAMAVLQSELYPKLADTERAECDEFIAQGIASLKASRSNDRYSQRTFEVLARRIYGLQRANNKF
jgi:hypothetical protein